MKPGKRHLVPYAALLRLLLGVAALAAPGAALSAESGNDGPGLTFGSVAMDIPAEMHRRLRPLMNYLSTELKRPVQLKLSADLSKAADELAGGNVDIAYLTPVAYIKAQRAGGARLVAKTVTRGDKSFQLMLVVRRDSPIKSVKDLAGKSFAFGDPAAILQRAVLVNAGLRLEQLGSHRFIGHYDNIARGVANGDFDAGILKDTTAYEWERRLRVIHQVAGVAALQHRRQPAHRRRALRRHPARVSGPRLDQSRTHAQSSSRSTRTTAVSPRPATPSMTSSASSSGRSRSSASAAAAAPPRRHRTASACGRWGTRRSWSRCRRFRRSSPCACRPRFAADGRP